MLGKFYAYICVLIIDLNSSAILNKLSRTKIICLVAILAIGVGCKATHKRNGKIKPGKPIPCPVKDC